MENSFSVASASYFMDVDLSNYAGRDEGDFDGLKSKAFEFWDDPEEDDNYRD
jgi:hypothetical protein